MPRGHEADSAIKLARSQPPGLRTVHSPLDRAPLSPQSPQLCAYWLLPVPQLPALVSSLLLNPSTVIGECFLFVSVPCECKRPFPELSQETGDGVEITHQALSPQPHPLSPPSPLLF